MTAERLVFRLVPPISSGFAVPAHFDIGELRPSMMAYASACLCLCLSFTRLTSRTVVGRTGLACSHR